MRKEFDAWAFEQCAIKGHEIKGIKGSNGANIKYINTTTNEEFSLGEKSQECGNCEHARQVGDKSCQHIVGCVSLIKGEVSPQEVKNSNVYEGYVYCGRRVGDIKDCETFGRGVLTFGLMTDYTGSCRLYTKLRTIQQNFEVEEDDGHYL